MESTNFSTAAWWRACSLEPRLLLVQRIAAISPTPDLLSVLAWSDRLHATMQGRAELAELHDDCVAFLQQCHRQALERAAGVVR